MEYVGNSWCRVDVARVGMSDHERSNVNTELSGPLPGSTSSSKRTDGADDVSAPSRTRFEESESCGEEPWRSSSAG